MNVSLLDITDVLLQDYPMRWMEQWNPQRTMTKGSRHSTEEELKSPEVRISNNNWINNAGKQNRSREAAQIFRPMVNTFCRGKSLEKKLKRHLSASASDETDVHNRYFSTEELESHEVRATKEAWTNAFGKPKRSRSSAQAFWHMVNLFTCCSGKTRVKKFRTPQSDSDETDIHNRYFSTECLEDLYTHGEVLGIGSFGIVYEGFRKSDGLLVAIKYISKSEAKKIMDTEGLIPLEVALMKQVNSAPASPYIVQLIDWFDHPTEYVMVLERPHPCLNLVEFCESQGGRLTEDEARTVMLQVVEALRTCQARGVLHRDLKPDNVLVQTDTLQVKLIDFGCGEFLKSTSHKVFAGARLFNPPEMFLQNLYIPVPATVWSVGVTLFDLVCGYLPFLSREEIIRARLFFREKVTTDCRHLVCWCLSLNPANRPTLEQIVFHPWFQ